MRLIAAVLLAALAASPVSAQGRWKPIFNGRNLDGWTPKFNHQPLGANFRDTFQVRDGVIRVKLQPERGLQQAF